MHIRWQWLGAALAAAPLAANAADAQLTSSQDSGNVALEQRLEQAEDHIKILERKLEVADETAATNAKSTPVVKASPAGFSIAAPDSCMVIKFRGNLAFDGRYFLDQYTPTTADTFLVRRARPYLEGTVDNIYDFRLMPDFGNGRAIIQDASITARVLPWLNVQAGKFKGPVGLERLQPEQYTRFMEAALPSDLLPYRDIGMQLAGTVLNGTLNYAAGYFIGTVDNVSTDANNPPDQDNDGKKDWEGRIFALPFANSDAFALRGLGVGLGGSYVHSTGVATSTATTVTTTSLLPTYRTPGQQQMYSYRGDNVATPAINEATIADGVRRRLTPQVYYYLGPVGVIAEYAEVTQQMRRQVDSTTTRYGTLQHNAWQVSASWFLTGEEAAYANFIGRSIFQPGKQGIGAWELAARYHEINFDKASFTGGAASFVDGTKSVTSGKSVGLGVNWYLNQNVKLQLNYDVTRYQGGVKNGDRPDEEALMTRFSLIF